MWYLMILGLLLSGCTVLGALRPSRLTPDQIKAYHDANVDIYTCFKVSGPPPSGGLTILTVPKGVPTVVAFQGNCDLHMARPIPNSRLFTPNLPSF